MKALNVGYDPRQFFRFGRKSQAIARINNLLNKRKERCFKHPVECRCDDCEMCRIYQNELDCLRNKYQERYHAESRKPNEDDEARNAEAEQRQEAEREKRRFTKGRKAIVYTRSKEEADTAEGRPVS